MIGLVFRNLLDCPPRRIGRAGSFVCFVVCSMAGRAGSIRGFVRPDREKREMYRNREMYREFPRFSINVRRRGDEMYRLVVKCIGRVKCIATDGWVGWD